MNSLKRGLIRKYRDREGIIGVILHENPYPNDALVNGFPYQALIVTDQPAVNPATSYHYIKEGTRLQERWISFRDLNLVWRLKADKELILFITRGEIIMDRDMSMEGWKNELMEFSKAVKDRMLLVEFSNFFTRYLMSKDYFVKNQLLDAYSCLVEALTHWAKIVIIEQNSDIYSGIWEQVKKHNAGVHKLYEELVLSDETLIQRVQLVMLACEFSIVTKMEGCCSMLLDVLSSRKEPWSALEILDHPELSDLDIDIPMLLGVLAKKTLIREVQVEVGEVKGEYEIKYIR
ncbi:Uncharacterised protein [Chlamydia abortus]|nr:Uncharacterised protein [Chlamydia abortus]